MPLYPATVAAAISEVAVFLGCAIRAAEAVDGIEQHR